MLFYAFISISKCSPFGCGKLVFKCIWWKKSAILLLHHRPHIRNTINGCFNMFSHFDWSLWVILTNFVLPTLKLCLQWNTLWFTLDWNMSQCQEIASVMQQIECELCRSSKENKARKWRARTSVNSLFTV